ncbi:MAG TPA: metallophosphoesterase [Candidatus Competibacteraceae bacterium]|nr:metallophosphoesterase [Candidatus Competibacteraceae bacterium]
MRTIAHLSDLHFGAVRPDRVLALRRSLLALAPDLVVVSGDLTQRARTYQFQAARAFLASLPFPRLVVPGNHDLPLRNWLRRLCDPLGRYRRHIADELYPVYRDEELLVLGLVSPHRLLLTAGWLSAGQREWVRRQFREDAAGRCRILVLHHPLDYSDDDLGARPHLILAGHRHTSRIRGGDEAQPLLVQAGTATSHRLRDEDNAYNVLAVHDDGWVEIAVSRWDGRGFRCESLYRYRFRR